jgi:hypothetical protein
MKPVSKRWHVATLFVVLGCATAYASTPVKPQPALKADTLTAQVGQPYLMSLKLPNGESWTTANIGRLIVRTFGKQQTIPPTPVAGTRDVAHTFTEPGYAMIVLSAGAGSEKGRSDAWQRTTYCAKLVVKVESNGGAPPTDKPQVERDPGLMSKVGQKIEIRPYISPATLLAGDDLPVRAYFDNEKQVGGVIKAIAPDGSIEEQTTNNAGYANFTITQAGRWLIRYEKEAEGMKYVADLIFEVPPGSHKEGSEG